MKKIDQNYKFVILKKREPDQEENDRFRNRGMIEIGINRVEWESPFEMELTSDEVIETMKFLLFLKNIKK